MRSTAPCRISSEAREVGGWPANSPIESKQALSSDGEMLEVEGLCVLPNRCVAETDVGDDNRFRILYNILFHD